LLQIHAELSEALAAAEAAYAECCSPSAAETGGAKQDESPLQQPQPQYHTQDDHMTAAAAAAAHRSASAIASQEELHNPSTAAAAAAAANSSTRVPAAASLAHPARSMPRMHPANLYCQQEPDFAALAKLHPPLAPYVSVHPVTGRASIDFTSWHATQQLTAALLAVDFGIDWSLPEGQLVPPVPNRANYVHWLHDLLQLSGPSGVLVLHLLLEFAAAAFEMMIVCMRAFVTVIPQRSDAANSPSFYKYSWVFTLRSTFTGCTALPTHALVCCSAGHFGHTVPLLPAVMYAAAGCQVRGLDIGCGANFIYCLLGAALYGWHMTGVDITQVGPGSATAAITATVRCVEHGLLPTFFHGCAKHNTAAAVCRVMLRLVGCAAGRCGDLQFKPSAGTFA
jgi:hypothetical protein